ncbi:MAG: hypothetical protein M3410_02990 [Acidobacteriota bacterium]|nr:hypothetical protein [Acidobacteriota bacterium]
MIRNNCYILLLLIVILSPTLFNPARTSRKPQGVPVSPQRNSASQKKALAILRVRGFAEGFLAGREAWARTVGLARLADLLWKDDEQYARALFEKALEVSGKSDVSATSNRQLASYRNAVLTLLAKRDAGWAKRVAAADSSSGSDKGRDTSMSTNLDRGYRLIKENPKQALYYADQSLLNGVDSGMYAFLHQFRLQDEKAADRLFLSVLDQLVIQPSVDAQTLLRLGTYIFTSPRIADSRTPTIMQTGVGQLLVPDITADRSGIQRALVRSYLLVASQLMMRPISDPKQRQMYYVAGRLLLPKAEKFSPELVNHFVMAMSALSLDIPSELTQDAAYQNFKMNPPRELEDELRDIEKMPNERQRDERYLGLTFDYYQKRDFSRARNIVAKMRDERARQQLEILIIFGEAVGALTEGDLEGAETLARKMPDGTERSLIWLGIGHARSKAADKVMSTEASNAALKSARRVQDAHKPFLLLSAAGSFATLDPILSQATFTEAVQDFNSRSAEELGRIDWKTKVETGSAWRHFPLRLVGVELGIEQVMPHLVTSNVEATIATAGRLNNENQRAVALIAVAATLLK